MMEMDNFEYVDVQKKNGRVIRRKIALVSLYIIYALTFLILGALTRLIAPLLAFIPLTIWMMVFATWRYTNIEYEYSISSGELTYSKIYGGRSRKTQLKVIIKDFESIWKLESRESYDRAEMYKPKNKYVAVSSLDDENVYFALFQNKKHEPCIFYFKANDKALKIMKYYNSHAFIGMWNQNK